MRFALRRWPLLQGLLPVERARLPVEIIAGLTLAALAIPEVMGYTKIAGTSVITGLYTMLIPAVLFSLFGASRHLVVGADSATAAILAAGLVGVAATGSDQYQALAGVLALMSAGLLLLARLVGLGFMADFLSRTVLTGFLTGVGIQVALSQLPGMLGLAVSGVGNWQKVLRDLEQLEQLNASALAAALAALVVIAAVRKFSARIPAALLAVTGAIAASWTFGLARYMPVIGELPSGLPHVGLPDVTWTHSLVITLLPTAFSMFVVILAQSAATSRAYAARYNERFNESVDLVGLGLANIGAGLSGTFVVNGSPTKTQMVDSAGGRSQLAQLVAALVVLLVLLFLTGPFAYLPEAVLSAVVFLIGLELVDINELRNIYQQRPSEFWIALTTMLMVVLVGVEQGILLSIVLSLVDHTRRGYRPRNALLVPTETGGWRPQPVATLAEALPGLAIYRFTHSLYYANVQQLTAEVSQLANQADPPLRWLCLDASAIDDVDYSAAQALRGLAESLRRRGIRVVVAQLMAGVQEQSRSQLSLLFGEDVFYDTLAEVVAAFRRATED